MGHTAEHPVAAEATPVTVPRRRQFPDAGPTTLSQEKYGGAETARMRPV